MLLTHTPRLCNVVTEVVPHINKNPIPKEVGMKKTTKSKLFAILYTAAYVSTVTTGKSQDVSPSQESWSTPFVEATQNHTVSPSSAMEVYSDDQYGELLALKTGRIILVRIPADSFSTDERGLPIGPMQLELAYKDLAGANGTLGISSRIEFVPSDLAVYADKRVVVLPRVSLTGSNEWKTNQYTFQKTPFQRIRVVDGVFTIGITSFANKSIPLGSIALSAIGDAGAQLARSNTLVKSGFRKIELFDGRTSRAVIENLQLQLFPCGELPVYEWTMPSPRECSRPIVGFGARGLIESLKLGLYSKSGVTNLDITVSDLTNNTAGTLIGAEHIKWYQVVRDNRALANPIRIGEKINRVYSPIQDRLEKRDALSIDRNRAESVWFKIHIPIDAKGGWYFGIATVKERGGIWEQTIEMRIKVLPIALLPPKNLNPVYLDPFSKTYAQTLEAVYDFYRDIGFDLFYILKESWVKTVRDENKKIVDFNLTEFEWQLSSMKNASVLKERMVIYALGRFLLPEITTPYADNDLYGKLSDPAFTESYGLLIQKLTEVSARQNVSLIFSLNDEPWLHTYEGMITANRLATIIRANSGLTTVTYDMSAEEEWLIQRPDGTTVSLSLKELIDYKVWIAMSQGKGYEKQYENYGYYTTFSSEIRIPIYNRFLHGILAFRTKARIVSAFAMGEFSGDPFDGFDTPRGTYFDFLYGYPSWDGPIIPALNGEGVAEGIKDARYLATLQFLIDNSDAPFSGDWFQEAVYLGAKEFIENLNSRIDPYYWESVHLQRSVEGEGYSFMNILRQVSRNGEPDFEAFTKVRREASLWIELFLSMQE